MPAPRYIQHRPEGVALALHIQPRARRSEIAGEYDGRLKLRIASPPVDGKANAEVCRYLANLLGVSKSSISIEQGAASRAKLAVVRGLSAETVQQQLAAAGAPHG